MDLNNIGKVEDRISILPDSLLYHVLYFLDIKCVARTSVLSKRWDYIWTSIPTLDFSCQYLSKSPSMSEINKFMEFVDRTLLLHDASNIQKFHLKTNKHMSASRVHSWIANLTRRNIEELCLLLDQDTPFFIPLSLFTCQSLIKLELTANGATHLPRSFCFPKLKRLKFHGIQFTDDCWNEPHFSNCPVLEELILSHCTWFGVRNFCISTPTLKLLKIYTSVADGLQDCALKVNAPNLVSLAYVGCVAKEYVLSSFQTLESAEVHFCTYDVQIEQKIGDVASKFIRALSHVQNLELHAETLEALSIANDFVNILPVFHDLKYLILEEGKTTDASLFTLFKAVPNLRWLTFEECCIDDNKEEEHGWVGHMLTAGCMFQHLRSVTFVRSIGNERQMRWLKLILKNAKALEAVILCIRSDDAIDKEVFMSELRSLPRTSDGCEFELDEY